jgi:Amt family ammonium transporter
MKHNKKIIAAGFAAAASLALAPAVLAQEAGAVAQGVSGEVDFIFNSFLFLISGMVVMFMAAGFCMLEVGMVRSKNAATICVKNIALYSISGLMFYLIGYNLMYGDGSSWIGSLAIWAPDDTAAVAGAFEEGGYAAGSDWFFQMVFCATAASIVSGTLAERIKLWPFLIFTAVLTGIIYPIQGSWEWGGGWLDQLGFSDFAGSTLVHSAGGWAALVGALILGPRLGKYTKGGQLGIFPGSSLPLATVGVFILWLGWFGFNGGSQLALGSAINVMAISQIFINTNLAAAAGCVTAIVLTQLLYKKVDLTMALNGAIGGLVSITAEPLVPAGGMAIFIGAIGGVLIVYAVPLLDKLKIDDVVGAIPAHLVCGIWGTLAVALTAENMVEQLIAQMTGVVAIGLFVSSVSAVVWYGLKVTIGIRVSPEEELQGLDKTELGLEAYPEFAAG